MRSLLAVQRREVGLKHQLATYLLAAIGSDYEVNRNLLLSIWRECVSNDFSHGCDENTGDFLIKLYGQGHAELLHPLMAGCKYADGALSEELYPFYLDRLSSETDEFLRSLARLPAPEQQKICERVGEEVCAESGGGPTDESYPQTMRNLLIKLETRHGETSLACSRSLTTGYRRCVESIKLEEAGPPRKAP